MLRKELGSRPDHRQVHLRCLPAVPDRRQQRLTYGQCVPTSSAVRLAGILANNKSSPILVVVFGLPWPPLPLRPKYNIGWFDISQV